jgi:hypothetical protein
MRTLNDNMDFRRLVPLLDDDLPVFGRFFSSYLNNGTQSVRLFHDRVEPDNGTDTGTGMELTVSDLSMTVDLDGITSQLIRRVELLELGIDFDASSPGRVFACGRLSILFELPANINMTYTALATSIDYRMRLAHGSYFGRMSLQHSPVQHDSTSNQLVLDFSRQELLVVDELVFEQFVGQLVLGGNVTIVVDGVADALATIPIGNITLSQIPVSETLHLVGYDRFSNGRLMIEQVDVVESLSSVALALRVVTQLTNPSVIHIVHAGSLTLDLHDVVGDKSLGTVIIDPFYLLAQGNVTRFDANATLNITDDNVDVAQRFISTMVSGQGNDVELRGRLSDNSTGTSISLLSLAIDELHIRARVPGLDADRTLVRNVLLKKLTATQIFGIPLNTVKTLSARIQLRNPFGTRLVISALNVRADYSAQIDENLQVGTVTDNQIITIGPYEQLQSPYVDVKITAKLSTMVALLKPLLAGPFQLSLSGFIDVIIGDEFVLRRLPLTLLNVTSMQEAST